MPKLSQFTERSCNNFGFLRFLAAAFVVHGHSHVLVSSSYPKMIFPWGQGYGGQLGVLIFFFISGFLVTHSWIKTQNTMQYLYKRIARIFPALIFIVLLNACIIAPLVTENTQATYWFSQGFYAYLGNITLLTLHTELPGVSQDTPISPQFWTLRVEFGLYLLVLLLGFLKEIRGFIWLTGALSLYFILGFGGSGVKLLSAILSFCFGASACHYAKIIPLRNIYMLAAAMIFGTCLFYPTLSLLPLTLAALAYLICWVAVLPVKWMNDSEKYVDPTYGLYLSSFFIGQLLLQYIPIRWNAYSLFGVTMLLGLSYGYFSWHFLEKRMLSLANRRP